MNIAKRDQRTLHALVQGGAIHVVKDTRGDIVKIDCLTREGWRLDDCTLDIFHRLRRRRLIGSLNGGPYRITRMGLAAVRAQLDNR